MLIIKENENYVAKVVKLPAPNKHPNADRLQIVNVDFQPVITGLDAKEGDTYLYFPLECKINKEFLSFTNSFSNKELNADKDKAGFFNDKARVRGVKLRGHLSEGYIHPIKSVNEWLTSVGMNFQFSEKDVGQSFDHIGDLKFVEKYIIQTRQKGERSNQPKSKKEFNRLIDGQFNLHPDTKHLKREIHEISPDDIIDVTSKWHGANCVISNILTKRKLTFTDRIAKFFGANIQDKIYDIVYSSRKVVKNARYKAESNHYYGEDIWGVVAKRYKESVQKGITLYGELVGYTSTGAGIQSMGGKVFDYGCEEGQCDFIVFRVTYTNEDGKVFEFTVPQMVDYCEKYGLKYVPIFYVGKAKDMYNLDTTNHWHENFLAKLQEDYLEKDCAYCRNKLPDEGAVVAKRIGGFRGFKLKSQKFLEGETKELDNEVENVDDG